MKKIISTILCLLLFTATSFAAAPTWHSSFGTQTGSVPLSWLDDNFSLVQRSRTDYVDAISGYGAKCDGSTDDRAAIQAAIAATPEGGTLVIPRGSSYCKITATQLSEALTVATRINIIIDAELRATSHANQVNPPYIINVTADGTTISGSGTLRGNGSYVVNEGTDDNCPGLLRIAAANVTVTGLNFVNPQEIGIYLRGATNAVIKGNRFTGGPLFAAATSSQYYYIEMAEGGNNISIIDNVFYMDGDGGSCRNAIANAALPAFYGMMVSGNQIISPHEHAIYIVAHNSICSNNVIRYAQALAGQVGNAIKFGGKYNLITGNNIYNALAGGITAFNAVGTKILQNNIYLSGYAGIEIANDGAVDYGLDYNEISHNFIQADTTTGGDIYYAIKYAADTGITAISKGGKIIGNRLIDWGTSGGAVNLASMYVGGLNGTYTFRNFQISDNTITGSRNNGIFMFYLTNSKVSGNIMYDNPMADFVAFYLKNGGVADTFGGIKFEANLVEDNQVSPTLKYFFYEDANYADINMLNNECYSASIANPFNRNTANVLGRGNKTSRVDDLVGEFYMVSEATKVITNANILDAVLDNQVSHVVITPLSANAATAMGSAKSLYVSAATAGTSFTVSTADGADLPATNHFFAYEIIQ